MRHDLAGERTHAMRPLHTLLTIVAVMVALAAVGAHAAVIHVPGDQPSIKEGIAAASEGDTVQVAAGTYSGALNRDIDFNGTNLTLVSESGYMSTVIDCGQAGRGLLFHSGEDTTSVVSGFTIQFAVADTGAGAWCVGGSSPRFEDCLFQLNMVTDFGGAVACTRASTPIFRSCTFAGNYATGGTSPRGGAVGCMGASHALLEGCSFSANTAAAFGGAVYCYASSPWFAGCNFTFNEATTQGGGAIFAASLSAPAVGSCTFFGNTAGTHGGAIYGQSSPVEAARCLFYGNESQAQGGAVSFLYPASAAQFTDCTFAANYAQIGGVLYCYDSANVTFWNCTFELNEASTDGSLLAANSASPVVTRSIVTSCQGVAPTYCGGTASPVFFRCVVFGNAAGDDLCGSVSDTLHRDPLFCDPAGYDWSLCEDSACAPANNAWGELIGSHTVGCGACGTAVEPSTWGGIKALFR
jgi:predicted outer membrane repeat protein